MNVFDEQEQEKQENEGDPSRRIPEVILPNSGGEILEKSITEPLVYSRKRFHKRKIVQIDPLAPSQTQEPSDSLQETQVIPNLDPIFVFIGAQDPNVVDLDLPIAITKGVRSYTTKHPIAKHLSYQKITHKHKAFL